MMKKNALWLWFVAVLAVNVLTACQKDDDDNTAPEPQRQHTEAVTALKGICDTNQEVRQLLEHAIRQAASINPDRRYNPAQSLEEFYDFVNEAKRRTLRTNDVDVQYGDPILTISTCNTDVIGDSRGRLILMARRVRVGEDLYEGTKNSEKNTNIKWPNIYYQQHPNEKYDPNSFVPYKPKKENSKANIED